MASQGAWQHAADSAAESLQLRRDDNDLASFVFLVARLSGAVGGPNTVPVPRREYLPASLQEFVEPIVTTTGRLRDAAADSQLHQDGLRELIAQAIDEIRGLGWLEDGLRAGGTTAPSRVERRSPRSLPRQLGAIMVGAMIGVSAAWVAFRRPPGQPVMERQDVLSQAAEPADVQRLESQISEANERIQSLQQNSEYQAAILREDWRHVARILQSAAPEVVDELTASDTTRLAARPLYLAGLDASRSNRYGEAAALLTAVVTSAPEDVYFYDDARYYQARALQRSGRLAEARVAFDRLVRDSPESVYARDARRFMTALENSGV